MHLFRKRAARVVGAFTAAAALMACSLTYDWREVRPADTGATLLFPCKPTAETRSAKLDGVSLRMTMWSCTAGKGLFAVAFAPLPAADQVEPTLAALLSAQAANLRVAVPSEPQSHHTVKGVAPKAKRYELAGRFPDGSAASQRLMYGASGTLVYQMAVLGADVPETEVESFFESLSFAP